MKSFLYETFNFEKCFHGFEFFFTISFPIYNYQMSCQKLISGGQTGVDRGILDAALACGFPCGGWCPSGRMAEDGIISDKYPLTELKDGSYADRTIRNVAESEGTLIITGPEPEGGTLLTITVAEELKKPLLIIRPLFEEEYPETVQMIINWINEYHIGVLNCAGPRASEWKEGYKTAWILGNTIFRWMKDTDQSSGNNQQW
jgi:Circularly permutated YpsA SLOG family